MAGQAVNQIQRQLTQRLAQWLRAGFWAGIVIAVAAAIRRLFALVYPSHSSNQSAVLDQVFAAHAALTVAHIVPALAFVCVAPFFVFRSSEKTSWPYHLLLVIGGVVAMTAYAMSVFSIGGWTERSAVLLFNTLFLFSLIQSYRCVRRGESAQKRRWMLRAIAILLGIATTRPVMGLFFATSPFTHLQPSEFFGIAFWIGFSLNTLLMELWLRFRWGKPRVSF